MQHTRQSFIKLSAGAVALPALKPNYYGYVRELLLTFDDRKHLQPAVAELESLLRVRQSAAQGKWDGWYRGDKKENLPALLERTRKLTASQ